jgi:hypothetical protein
MYKYIALSVRTCARIPHNPCVSPHSPYHHVFTGPINFQNQVTKCMAEVRSKFNVLSAVNNLSSGGYSSKCKDAVCVCIRQVCQDSPIEVHANTVHTAVKRGRCYFAHKLRHTTFHSYYSFEIMIKTLVRMGYC